MALVTIKSWKKYSLADYQVSLADDDLTKITVGGRGAFLGSISVSWSSNVWDKQMDVTGSGVYNKNYDRSGEIRLSLNQLASNTIELMKLWTEYYGDGDNNRTLDITISRNGEDVIEASTCVLSKMPDWQAQDTAGNREFVFLSMEIVPKIPTTETSTEG